MNSKSSGNNSTANNSTVDIHEFSKRLRNLHRRFLENIRYEVENELGRTISPYEFLALLTQNAKFLWLKPFSSIVAEVDALTDADPQPTADQVTAAIQNLEKVISEEPIAAKYILFSTSDMEFIQLHIQLNKIVTVPVPTLQMSQNSQPDGDPT